MSASSSEVGLNLNHRKIFEVFLFMMATVYILFSKKLNRFYTGSCNDLQDRLLKHQTKIYSESYTTNSDDWELYHTINGLTYEQARSIELHIKKMKSKVYIENLLKYPEIIERLKQLYV
jgi:putative endonuclease